MNLPENLFFKQQSKDNWLVEHNGKIIAEINKQTNFTINHQHSTLSFQNPAEIIQYLSRSLNENLQR